MAATVTRRLAAEALVVQKNLRPFRGQFIYLVHRGIALTAQLATGLPPGDHRNGSTIAISRNQPGYRR
jgi:hypothetical protein